jgi:hypothetical protein
MTERMWVDKRLVGRVWESGWREVRETGGGLWRVPGKRWEQNVTHTVLVQPRFRLWQRGVSDQSVKGEDVGSGEEGLCAEQSFRELEHGIKNNGDGRTQ